MDNFFEILNNEWNKRNGPIIFTTTDKKGIPNSIYASGVSKFNDNTIIIADNYFNKTRENILSGSTGSILFITDEKKSYQLKGIIKYYKDGEYFENMKKWNSEKLPGIAAAVFEIQEAYSGAEKIL
jgi:uncharacterized protein